MYVSNIFMFLVASFNQLLIKMIYKSTTALKKIKQAPGNFFLKWFLYQQNINKTFRLHKTACLVLLKSMSYLTSHKNA